MKTTNKRIAFILALGLFIQGFMVTPEPARAVSISKEAEWNISRINAESSYEDSKNLPKIKVALLDSGLDTDEDIPFVEREDFLGDEELHPLFQDSTGHGTSVAGIICARKSEDRICGIASNVDLYVARVLDSNNHAPVDRIVEAIDWAIQKKVNIIHMSFGTKYYSEELEDAIQRAYRNNILIIASAGNDGNAAEDESTIEYPAVFDEVLSVGATNADNAITETSSTGEELDVVAPGDQILSIGAFGGVLVDEGTSISAAHVTGVAAVLWGKHPDASNSFIKELLSGSSNESAISGDCGNGIIDYEQTESNYEKMSNIYQLCKMKGYSETESAAMAGKTLVKNRNELPKDQKVNYVNGAWSGKTHRGYVDTAVKDLGLSTQDIDIDTVKLGATIPDSLDETKKMSAHPCFHGGSYYFCNLAYLYDSAKLYFNTGDGNGDGNKSGDENKNENLVDLPKLIDYYIDQAAIKSLTKKEKISDELGQYGNKFFGAIKKYLVKNNKMSDDEKFTNKQKGYILLGAALHTITDAVAHQGCRKDTKYKTGFSQIIHKRYREEPPVRPEDGFNKGKHYFRDMLWEKYSDENNKNVLKSDREYYKYLLDNFAIADNAEQLEERNTLALNIAKKVLNSFQENFSYKTMLANVGEKLKTNAKKVSKKYRIVELNTNWKTANMGTKKFKLNIDKKDISKGAKIPKDITVSIENGKIKVKFLEEEKCRYLVYCENRADISNNLEYVYFKDSTKKKSKKKTFTLKKGKLKGNVLYISVFYGSKRIRKEYEIVKKIVYIKNKTKKVNGKLKTVSVKKEQKVDYGFSKTKFKLLGKIFKAGKKKKLAGWAKKKDAKKITYKLNKSIKFKDDTTLLLYAVIK